MAPAGREILRARARLAVAAFAAVLDVQRSSEPGLGGTYGYPGMSAIRRPFESGLGGDDGHPGGSPSKPLKPGLGGGDGHRGGPPFKNPSSRGSEVGTDTGGVHRSKNPSIRGSEVATGTRGGPPFKNPSSRGSEVATGTSVPAGQGGQLSAGRKRGAVQTWAFAEGTGATGPEVQRRNPGVGCASCTQKPGQFARAPGHHDGGATRAKLAEARAGVATPQRGAA